MSFPLQLDDAIVNARAAIGDGLLEYLNNRLQVFGETGLIGADLADGLLVSVLRLVAPKGRYPMEESRFWQILDRHGPSSPLSPEETVRARLAVDIEGLFAAAQNESFEDGFDSSLSVGLQRLVLKYGETALEIVSDLILEHRVAPEASAEALGCLGEMEDDATHEARRRLLEGSLRSSSHVTRDGAVVGLADLGDPRSIPALEAAAAREQYRLLRASMIELLEQLKGPQT